MNHIKDFGPLYPGVVYVQGDGKFGAMYRGEVKKGFDKYAEAEAWVLDKKANDPLETKVASKAQGVLNKLFGKVA